MNAPRPAVRRASRIQVLAVAAATALLAGCGAGADASADARDGQTDGGRTVETQLGPVTVPETIDSVVVIEGRRDLDIAFALDLPVVGFPVEEPGSLDLESPLAADMEAAKENGAEELFLADEINVEAIAEAAPSLILSRVDDVEPILDELQAIAPVLVVGEQDTATWQDDLRLVAEATGREARAEELIAEYDARVAEISTTYADVIAANPVVPLGVDSEKSQTRPNRLLSTALRDVGATPSALFAEAIETGEGVERGPEELLQAASDATGVIALVNSPDDWAALADNSLWTQLPAVAAGHVVRSDKSTHEGGPITALHSLDVIESLYATF